MHNQIEETEDLACRLEATGNYKILRRLVPPQPTQTSTGCGGKVGVIVDFETTGLDANKDEIIEVAMVKFGYSNGDQVIGVTGTFQAFNQPSIPIPANIIELTGISDEMVAGHKIDDAALVNFVADANVIIAHNAAFDRKFAERSWPLFEHMHWACSATGIDWQQYGFGGAKLTLFGYAIRTLPRRAQSHRRLPCDPRNLGPPASGDFHNGFGSPTRPRPPQDGSDLGRKRPVRS